MNMNRGDQGSGSTFQKDLPLEGSVKIWSALWTRIISKKISRECLFSDGPTRNIYEFWQRAYAKDLLKLIQNRNYNDFLELGAGRGTTSMYLSNAGIHQITLLDLSEEAKRLAYSNFEKFQLHFKDFVLADVRKTPFPDESFDCIYNIGLLEHFENPGEVLKEAFRLLRKEGLIFMPVFPDITSPHSFLLRLIFNPLSYIKRIFKTNTALEDSMIRTKRTLDSYEAICKKMGFRTVECLYYNPFPKIVRDGWYENYIILNLFKIIYKLRNIPPRKLQLRTNSFFGSAYLVIAYK